MQHYTFAVNAFVEMVKQFGKDCKEGKKKSPPKERSATIIG